MGEWVGAAGRLAGPVRGRGEQRLLQATWGGEGRRLHARPLPLGRGRGRQQQARTFGASCSWQGQVGLWLWAPLPLPSLVRMLAGGCLLCGQRPASILPYLCVCNASYARPSTPPPHTHAHRRAASRDVAQGRFFINLPFTVGRQHGGCGQGGAQEAQEESPNPVRQPRPGQCARQTAAACAPCLGLHPMCVPQLVEVSGKPAAAA